MKDDRDLLLAVGFDAYLEKPLNVREFPSQIAAVLTRADMGSRT
jgi:DNA-binding response OmpR family regulator